MDSVTLQAASSLFLFAAFIGIWIWAWSKKRKPDFDRAAQMPLEEDAVQQGNELRGNEKE